jgi:hypothetical protein
MKTWCVASLLAFALSAATAARAQPATAAPTGPRDASRADALFREARELIRAGEHAKACPKLAESQRLDPAPGTLVNLGDCQEKIGRLADALRHYREGLERLPDADERSGYARSRLIALAPRVPRLTLTLGASAPEGTRVALDGVAVPSAVLGTALEVNPGAHTLLVGASGRRERAFEVSIAEGEARTLAVEPGEEAPVEAPPPAPVAPPVASAVNRTAPEANTEEPGSQSLRPFGLALAGVGVVGVAIGTIYSVKASSSNAEAEAAGCDDSTCPTQRGLQLSAESRTYASAATAGWVIGALGLLGGGAIYLLSADETDGGAAVRVKPVVGAQVAGVGLGGRW